MLKCKLDVIMTTTILFSISIIHPNWQIVIVTKKHRYITDMHHVVSHTQWPRSNFPFEKDLALMIVSNNIKMRGIMQMLDP